MSFSKKIEIINILKHRLKISQSVANFMESLKELFKNMAPRNKQYLDFINYDFLYDLCGDSLKELMIAINEFNFDSAIEAGTVSKINIESAIDLQDLYILDSSHDVAKKYLIFIQTLDKIPSLTRTISQLFRMKQLTLFLKYYFIMKLAQVINRNISIVYCIEENTINNGAIYTNTLINNQLSLHLYLYIIKINVKSKSLNKLSIGTSWIELKKYEKLMLNSFGYCFAREQKQPFFKESHKNIPSQSEIKHDLYHFSIFARDMFKTEESVLNYEALFDQYEDFFSEIVSIIKSIDFTDPQNLSVKKFTRNYEITDIFDEFYKINYPQAYSKRIESFKNHRVFTNELIFTYDEIFTWISRVYAKTLHKPVLYTEFPVQYSSTIVYSSGLTYTL
jgi:hypothetical protein